MKTKYELGKLVTFLTDKLGSEFTVDELQEAIDHFIEFE